MAGVVVRSEDLKELVARVFVAMDCSADEAGRIALYLVNANLTGHDSHGVVRVPRYVTWVRDGTLVPNRQMTVVSESDGFAVIDGGYGFGQSIGPQAVGLGIQKAARHGTAIVALRSSGHLGRIGEWAEMAAEAGQVSIHMVNVAGSCLVSPFGAIDRRMSTNPFAAGVPLPDRPPLILDFATSVVAEGKVLVAYNGGKPLPPDSLITSDGRLTSDPEAFYGPHQSGGSPNPREGLGAIRAMGEHKGSGLAFMMELLGGALTGSGCAGPGTRRVANGMLSIYLTPEAFGAADGFADEVRTYVDFFKSARPAVEGGEVLVPGEPERRSRAARLADGIPIPEPTWQAIQETAQGLGV